MPKQPAVTTRLFFECGECGNGIFHEESLIFDHTKFFNLGTMPCGGETNTEVHYLDGRVEKVAKTD